jgi:hypothetical protein
VCEYGESPELVDACELRAEHDDSGLTPALDLTATTAHSANYSCVGRCGETQPYCACDYWCFLFGDCCGDYYYVCE